MPKLTTDKPQSRPVVRVPSPHDMKNALAGSFTSGAIAGSCEAWKVLMGKHSPLTDPQAHTIPCQDAL